MISEEFNRFLGIKESYQMPERLMEIITGDHVGEFFEEFKKTQPDLSHDVLRDYFQMEHGDRDKMKQDYTPDCVCELVRRLSGDGEDVLDVCAGTGALSIACRTEGYHRAEEVSTRALPVLLLNFGIRGMRGEVVLRDVLTGKTERIYEMEPCGDFTRPVLKQESDPRKWKRIVSNPPYSLKFKGIDKAADDPRFSFGLTPGGLSDYLFVQDGLSRLDAGGTLVEILPHGVLFRGKREEKIRKSLIENNLIDAVIGLPDNLFMNTGIPVLLMVLKKNRNCSNVLMVDASKESVKSGRVNVMTPEQIDQVCSVVKLRRDVDKLSHVATLEEIRNNGYNLNIPRYVDTFEPEPVPDLMEALTDLNVINRQIEDAEREFIEIALQLTGTDDAGRKLVEASNRIYMERMHERSQKRAASGSGNDRASEERQNIPGRGNDDRTVSDEGSRQISFF